jgi:hypothetical protein
VCGRLTVLQGVGGSTSWYEKLLELWEWFENERNGKLAGKVLASYFKFLRDPAMVLV